MKRKITLLAAAFLLTANCLLPALSFATCQAGFTWTQTAPNVIAFTNTSTGGVNPSYSWNFGDSQSANAFSPTHTYNAPGTYWVCLQMWDLQSLCSTWCDSVTVTGSINCNLAV